MSDVFMKFSKEHDKIVEEATHLHTFNNRSVERLHKQEQLLAEEEMKHHPGRYPTAGDDFSFYAAAMNFALMFVLPLVVMTIAGRFADQKFGTDYMALTGMVLALIGGSVAMFRYFLSLIKKSK